jgi:ubiquinone biosynthesis protein COQ4
VLFFIFYDADFGRYESFAWQNHDFFHALTGLPPTVLGELGLKWLELFQTGLPIAALSCTVGSLRLDDEERHILQNSYLPWAVQHMNANKNIDPNAPSCSLMNVYFEKEFDTPIKELRKRLNLVAAPSFQK